MENFLSDNVQAILVGLIGIVFVLSRLARWFPHISWLQLFRLPVIQMSEQQRAERRRRGNRMAGLEMVLAGIGLPILYLGSTIMLFSKPQTIPMLIVTACAISCIALGIWIFVRNW